jgi:hypothetical protein
MVVLGVKRVDFVVSQFGNGVEGDDCQEILVGSGSNEGSAGGDAGGDDGSAGGEGGVSVDLDFVVRKMGWSRGMRNKVGVEIREHSATGGRGVRGGEVQIGSKLGRRRAEREERKASKL